MLVSNRFQQHFKKQRFLTEKRWRWKWSRPRNGWQGEQPELGHSCNHLAWRWDVGRQTDGFCLGFQCPNWDLYDLYNMYAYIYILDWFIYIYIFLKCTWVFWVHNIQWSSMESKMMQLVFTQIQMVFKFQNPNWVSPSRWVSSAKWDFTPRFIGRAWCLWIFPGFVGTFRDDPLLRLHVVPQIQLSLRWHGHGSHDHGNRYQVNDLRYRVHFHVKLLNYQRVSPGTPEGVTPWKIVALYDSWC